MSHYIPYTYLIGWKSLNKWYYGVRYSKFSNPSELWVTYFTSSKLVKQYREQYGEPDVVEVRKTFHSQLKARDWEYKVLKRMKVKHLDHWLNQCENRFPFNTKDKSYMQTPEYRKAVSDSKKGKPAPNKGIPQTEEQKRKFKETIKRKQNLGLYVNPNQGKKHSKETRKKISEAGLRRYQSLL